MLRRIELECRGKKPEQIKELNLDNRRTTGEIEGLTGEFIGLETLSMNNVGLTSLNGFPILPKLKKLELSDNRISGKLGKLKGCHAITHLYLSGNKIKDIGTLKPLSEMTQLKVLDVFNCDISKEELYRESVFNAIPQLKYLDGFDQNENEALDSDDEENEVQGSADEEEYNIENEDSETLSDDEEEEEGDNDGEERKWNEESEEEDQNREKGAEEDSEGDEEEEDDEIQEDVSMEYLYKKDLDDEGDEVDRDYNDVWEQDEEYDIGSEDDDITGTSQRVKRKMDSCAYDGAPSKVAKSEEW